VVPARLSGLEPIVEGYMYEGSPAEIAKAITAVRAAGPPFELSFNEASGIHTLRAEHQTLQLQERRAYAHHGLNNTNRDRVREPVPGLYDFIDPKHPIRDWSLVDSNLRDDVEFPRTDDALARETTVYTPAITSLDRQLVQRAYDPETNTLSLEQAFLDKLPKWIKTLGPGIDPIGGIPTHTYLTLRQMKDMDVPYGSLQRVEMKNVLNVRAVIEFNAMLQEGIDPDTAALRTYNSSYAEGPVIQSGHRVVAAKWIPPKDGLQRIDPMLRAIERAGHEWPDTPTPEMRAKRAHHDRLFAEYGKGLVTRFSRVFFGYDLILSIVPF
jgi:hypothetical protein